MTDPDRPELPGQPGRPHSDDRLRALLEDAVADVNPSPALDRIRARTKVTPMRRTRPWLLVTTGAVAATAATIAAVSLADGRSPQADNSPGPAATTTATPTEVASGDPSDGPSSPAATEATPTPSEGGTTAPGSGTGALPVYFVGDTPAGPRLFREFQPAPAGTGTETSARVLAALEAAVAGHAADPDYGSGWPAGTKVVGASGAGSPMQVAVQTVGDPSRRPAGMTRDQAELALQQLVYTAQAVVQERDPVQFTAPDGTPLTRLLGVDVTDPVAQADPMQVQAPVWVISPQDGQQVGRTFTVEGRGAFFEANVSWQLLDAPGGKVVDKGFTTATECCTLAAYSFTVTAPPGDYVLRVYDADPSGGDGNGEQQDTKRITVR